MDFNEELLLEQENTEKKFKSLNIMNLVLRLVIEQMAKYGKQDIQYRKEHLEDHRQVVVTLFAAGIDNDEVLPDEKSYLEERLKSFNKMYERRKRSYSEMK